MKKYFLISIFFVMLCGNLLAQHSNYYNKPDLLFKEATQLFNNQQYQKSINLFKEFLESDSEFKTGSSVEAKYHIAMASLRLNRDEAEGLMMMFAKENPSSNYANTIYYELGIKLFNEEKYTNALKYFRLCQPYRLTKDKQPEYYFKKGFSHFSLDQLEDALVDFQEVMQTSSSQANAALFYYSHINYQQENYQTALEGFSKLENEAAYMDIVPYYMAQIYHFQKQYDKLLEYSPTLLMGVASDRTAEIARITGDAYYAKKDYNNAIIYLERYKNEVKKPTREDLYHLGVAYYQIKDYNNASTTLSKLTTREDALTQNAYLYLADCYLKSNNKKMAHLSFKAASRYEFDKYIQEEALYNYARLNFELAFSPFNETITAFEQFLDLFPESTHIDEILDLLGNVYMTTKNYEQAYQSIIKIQIKNVKVRQALQRVTYFRAVEHFNDGRYKQAIQYFNESLKQDSYNKKFKLLAYYWRGEAWYRTGEYNRALSDYNTFITSPGAFPLSEFTQAHYNMAYTFFKKQNYNAAINWFRKYTNLVKNGNLDILADAYNRTADCYYLKRNFNQAINFYEDAIETGGTGSDYALFQKGFCLGLRKQQDMKITNLNDLITQFPNSQFIDDAWFEKGKAYLSLEQHNEALAAYNVIINDYKNSSYYIKALSQVALVNYNIGEIDKSQEIYKEIINLYPSSAEAQSALVALKNISIDRNQIEEYINFTKKVKGLQSIEKAEEDSLTFIAAERLYMTGNVDDSKTYFASYLNKFPTGRYQYQAHYYKADCHLRLEDNTSALIELKALIQPPRNRYTEEALAKGASIHFENKDYSQALEWYSDLLRNAEKKENLINAKIGVLRTNYLLNNSGASILAADDLLKETKLSPEILREALYKKGRSFVKLENNTAALEALQKVAIEQQTTEGAESKYLISQIYFDNDSLQMAEDEIFDFIGKNTPHQYWLGKSFILLAKIYTKKGDLFQARQYLQSVRDNYSGEDDTQTIVTKELEALKLLEEKEMEEKGKQTFKPSTQNDSIQ